VVFATPEWAALWPKLPESAIVVNTGSKLRRNLPDRLFLASSIGNSLGLQAHMTGRKPVSAQPRSGADLRCNHFASWRTASVRPGGCGTRPPWGGRTRARHSRDGRVSNRGASAQV